MTLLAPGTMLLAALLAVPPLVVFYLLKLRRRPMRVTSTMLWDQAARDLEVNVPFRWIRPSWLLLLHILILGALLIAIGRPAVEGKGGAGRVFLLIDRSASMSAQAEGGTRLELAKERAKQLVGSMADSREPPEITVVAFAAEPVIMGPPARDTATVRSMIDAIGPTDQPGDPAGALALVRSLTQTVGTPDDDDEAPPAVALLIGDGAGLTDRASAGVPLQIETVGGQPPPNLGIASFAADRGIESPERVRVFLRLLNTGTADASVPIVVRFDNEPIDRRALTIPGRSSGGPGETVESFDAVIPLGGVLTVSLERDDALDSDNTVHATLPPVRRPAVLLVVPEAVRTDQPALARDRADPLLLDVLDAIGTAALRVVDRRQFAASQGESGDGITDRFGLVIFDRVRPARMPAVPTISFGAPLPASPETGLIRAADAGRTRVLAWNRDHPVMRDAVLDTVVIADRLRFPEDDEPLTGGATEPVRATLARGDTGPLIVAIDDGGIPRLAVSFALDQSNWPVHFSFPIFVLASFDFLVPGGDAGSWERTADEITIDAPTGAATLVGPAPGTDSRRVGSIDPAGPQTRRVPLGRLDRSGLYTVEAGGGRTPLAVNLLDPGESGLAVREQGDPTTDETSAAGSLDRGPVEVWRWFVLIAGVGLLLEWLVFTLKGRA